MNQPKPLSPLGMMTALTDESMNAPEPDSNNIDEVFVSIKRHNLLMDIYKDVMRRDYEPA